MGASRLSADAPSADASASAPEGALEQVGSPPPREEPPAVVLEHAYAQRAERWIALGRALLATVPPLIWRMGGYATIVHPAVAHVLLWGYLAYAWLVVAATAEMRAPVRGFQIATHAVDLGMYAVFVYLFEGLGNPFSFYFAFTLVAAAIRWQWRETLITAVIALALFVGASLLATSARPETPLLFHRWLFRIVYLTVVGSLLGYLGAYQARLHRDFFRLAVPPTPAERLAPSRQGAIQDILLRARDVLNAPRVMLLSETEDGTAIRLLRLEDATVVRSREPVESDRALIAPDLRPSSFFCLDAAHPKPMVWRTCSGGVRPWRGRPVDEEFRSRFKIRQLLALRMHSASLSGYLLAMDKPEMTSDDLALGQIVAREATDRIDHITLAERLGQVAVDEERLRLAGDLHDGLLQSLTAASLEMETARALLSSDAPAARQPLERAQELLRAEQHDLRFLIEALRPVARQAPGWQPSLAERLKDFAETVTHVWKVRVELHLDGVDRAPPRPTDHELYRLVQEAVINAARHARASTVWVELRRTAEELLVRVSDDGHGFPFQGRMDGAALAAQNLGPVSLRQRVLRLGGRLTIDSAPTGATVAIALPVAALDA